jgi:hypothetical protein
LNSGSGKAGDSCEDSIGSATCGDGLGCYQMTAAGGVCAAFCDATDVSHACSTGTCETIVSQAGNVQLCITLSADGG